MKKLVVVLAVVIILSVGLYFLIKPYLSGLQAYLETQGIWAIPLFLLLQVFFTVIFCFVPGTSMMFVTLGVVLFHDYTPHIQLAIILGGIIIASQGMFVLGRYGGRPLAVKFVGEEDVIKAEGLIKKPAMLPLMYMLPMFPDDALCFVAGVGRMNFWRHLIIVALFRGIGAATIILLGNFNALYYINYVIPPYAILPALILLKLLTSSARRYTMVV